MKHNSSSPRRAAETIYESACAIIEAVETGKMTLDDAIDLAPGEYRRVLEHLTFTFFRRRKFLEKELLTFCRKPPLPALMRRLLVVSVQCLFQRGIAPESAVSVAVEQAKKGHCDKFFNAVLRKLLAEPPVAPEDPESVLPDPLLQRWKRRFSREDLGTLTACFLREADFTFRLLPGAAMPETGEEIPGHGPFRFARGEGGKVLSSEAFQKGDYYAQDPAASFAVSLALEDLPRAKKVLDLCSAPGGKTLMLSEHLSPGADLTAADVSAARQIKTKENFALRRRDCRIITARPEELYGEYDIVLADMPCTNTGVFRRRPDALWRFQGKSLAEAVKLQQQILREAARLTAPGGILIASTCSIEPEENEGMTDRFLADHPDWTCESCRTLLPSTGSDGAFAARLRKENT